MDNSIKQRIAYALQCKPEEVPEDPQDLQAALDNRRAKLREVKRGKPIHQPV